MAPQPRDKQKEWDSPMLYYSLVFHMVRRTASALGFTGIAAIAGHIAWILFLIGVSLLVTDIARRPMPSAA